MNYRGMARFYFFQAPRQRRSRWSSKCCQWSARQGFFFFFYFSLKWTKTPRNSVSSGYCWVVWLGSDGRPGVGGEHTITLKAAHLHPPNLISLGKKKKKRMGAGGGGVSKKREGAITTSIVWGINFTSKRPGPLSHAPHSPEYQRCASG